MVHNYYYDLIRTDASIGRETREFDSVQRLNKSVVSTKTLSKADANQNIFDETNS